MHRNPGQPASASACLLLILLLLAGGATAAEVPPGYDSGLRPDPDGPPTRVEVAVFVIDVTEIDDISQSFTASLYFQVEYRDPRLADPTAPRERVYPVAAVWWPDLGLVNRRDLDLVFPNVLRVDPEGNVVYTQRTYGDFSARLDLRRFPFDKQELPIEVVSYSLGSDEIELVADRKSSGRLEHLSLTGWRTLGGGIDAVPGRTEARNLEQIVFHLAVARKVSFYRWSILVPLCFIVLMAWCVFWIDPQYLPTQVGLSTAAVFSLIAFRFSLRQFLPKVDYMTYLDEFVLASTVLVFLALGQAITTGRLSKLGHEALAGRMDYWSRIIYLVLFVLVTLLTLRLRF